MCSESRGFGQKYISGPLAVAASECESDKKPAEEARCKENDPTEESTQVAVLIEPVDEIEKRDGF